MGAKIKTIVMMAYIKKRFAVKAWLENASYYFNSGKGWLFLQWLKRWQPILIMANSKVRSYCAKLAAPWWGWPRLKTVVVVAKLRTPYLIFSYWTRMACALNVAYTCKPSVLLL
jgi:hypothetical protein